MKISIFKPYLQYVSEIFPEIEFIDAEEECPESEVLIGEPNHITKEKLEKLPNIKWIQCLRAGFDTIDIEYIKKRNITYTNAKDIYSVPIAEDVICKMLMHNTNALSYLQNQKNHTWTRGLRRKEFCSQTVGIIGTGSIATEIAKRLQGFGVNVIGYKRTPVTALPYFNEVYSGQKALDLVLSISDYIIITVDLNKETYHMINKDNLKLMKKEASIINIARGSVINQKDLTEVLKNKEISYAGLDVFETEPLSEDDELWDLDNVYITPHASGVVKNNKDRLKKLIADNIKRYVENDKLANIV